MNIQVISIKIDFICWAENLVSHMRHTSELFLSNSNKPLLVRRNSLPPSPWFVLYFKTDVNADVFSVNEDFSFFPVNDCYRSTAGFYC